MLNRRSCPGKLLPISISLHSRLWAFHGQSALLDVAPLASGLAVTADSIPLSKGKDAEVALFVHGIQCSKEAHVLSRSRVEAAGGCRWPYCFAIALGRTADTADVALPRMWM